MTIRQVCFCSFSLLLALVGAVALMAIALDVVSVQSPRAMVIHYAHQHDALARVAER